MAARPLRDRLGVGDVRYDAVLAGIPTAFGLSYLFAAAHLPSEAATLGVASLASGVVVLAALFYDPPRESGA